MPWILSKAVTISAEEWWKEGGQEYVGGDEVNFELSQGIYHFLRGLKVAKKVVYFSHCLTHW
jgi:hypothetical protein